MEIKMKLYEIYFSPTNGTKKAADIICSNLNYEKTEINLMDKSLDLTKYSFDKEDICLVAVPSFGGRVPAIATSSLSKLKADNTLAVCMVVYGNRAYDDTLLELKDTLTKSGFKCTAAVAAIAEHSILRQFAANRPDSQDEAQLIEFSKKINAVLNSESHTNELKVPGNKPYREYSVLPTVPTADKSCKKCGICADGCPVNAIPKSDPSLVDKDKCISCMHCVSICPTNSRGVNKLLLKAAAIKLSKACKSRKDNELFL